MDKAKEGLSVSKEKTEKPVYVPPELVVVTSEEILAEIGPAQACCGPNPYKSGRRPS